MERIVDYLRDKYGNWGWMGQRAHDGAGIDRVLPLDFMISCDYGAEIPYYFREEDVFSVEKRLGLRKDWSNEDLGSSFKGALGREILERWKSYKKGVNLICYRSIKKLEGDRPELPKGFRLYAMPERLKRHFDNKVLLFKTLPKLLLPHIPGRIVRLGKVTFKGLRGELSLPFVVQFPYGSSGLYTFVIQEERQYRSLRRRYPEQTVVVRRYIDGFALNVNGIIVSTADGPGTHCVFPSVQITGRRECSNFPSAFCGNDYAAACDVDPYVIRQVKRIITVVGEWMARSGFRGIFGMDLLVEKGVVYPVEINPRFQNSTSLHTVLSSATQPQRDMLFLAHVAEFLQKSDGIMERFLKAFRFEELMQPLKGAQIILHNRMRKSVVTGSPAAGVYRPDEGRLRLVRKGATLNLCRNRRDILVTCGVPRPDMVIEPNAVVCKIQSPGRVLDSSDNRSLDPGMKRIVSRVYEKLGLRDTAEVEAARSL